MSVFNQCLSCNGFAGFCSIANDDGKLCAAFEPAINNSLMFRRIFSPKGRIRRAEFCLSYILYLIAYMFFSMSYEILPHSNYFVIWWVIFIVLYIIMILQGIKRCHDLGRSGWWVLVPFYNPLWLMFGKGDDGINEYGSDPTQSYESQFFNEEEYLKNHKTEIGEE